jgi:hypothetical protein
MKKLGLVLGVLTMLAAQNLFAAMVTLSEIGVGNATGGGLFQAVTTDNGTFDTFCLSINTEFSPGTPYNYSVSPAIVYSPPPAGYPSTPPTYITYGAAYIYNQFLNGNATYGGTHDGTTVNNVQYTIWYLQGLLNPNYQDPRGYDYSSIVPTILLQLEADTHDTLAQLTANGNGAFGVEAMNLHDGIYQPQLIQVVPEPAALTAAALLLMLPLGASVQRILRKSRTA